MIDLRTFEMNLQWEARLWKQKKEACEPPWVVCHTDKCAQQSFSFMSKVRKCSCGRNNSDNYTDT